MKNFSFWQKFSLGFSASGFIFFATLAILSEKPYKALWSIFFVATFLIKVWLFKKDNSYKNAT